MSSAAVFTNVCCSLNPPGSPGSASMSFGQRRLKHLHYFSACSRAFSGNAKNLSAFQLVRRAVFRIRSFQDEGGEMYEAPKHKDITDEQVVDEILRDADSENTDMGELFLLKLAVILAVAVILTVLSFGENGASLGSLVGVQCLSEVSSSSSLVVASPIGFTFNAFGYRFILPEYAPGWLYFWLLMAAGCGLFISEEALNIWVGISLARMLSLGGTWHLLVESLLRNAPHILSTVLWVYWGVCISDMIPFYLGKWFRQSGGSDDVCSKLGIGKEKALSITRAVKKYGNLIGFVERFSLGVRNPTAFLAGAMGISPEYFFAGVCCGGLITLPIQLGIGFLLRERPVFALTTVATAVGIWTVFPYLVAASTALFLFLRRRYSS
ncbi:hypothetical protein SLEP1_g13322 [Rubroshorea leprosula]|uniref:VTT domain-containing protein n=1 Tax=Rubroshorea leprosula TaxID=152421 RepID=A0AAV5IPC7_9ROSI|nr:hypothetical protein SLEP1_g13322 [Rubroshorea leprosula]